MSHSPQTVTVADGTRLAVHIWAANAGGTPADLLLVHGFPASGATFAEFVETVQMALAPAVSLRVVAPDLRGYGDSDKAETGYTCERFTADVLAVADALELRDYVLAAHSMGGKIAQLVAASRPANLRGLILITPGLLAASPPVDVEGRIAAHGDDAKTRALLTGWVARPLDTDAANRLTSAGLQAGRDAWEGWLSVMRNEDFAERAAQIAVPTLVIGAGKDTQRTEEELQTGVVQAIPNARYAALPMSGHLPHVEDPVTLAALVTNFWDTLPVGNTEGTTGVPAGAAQ